MNILIPTIPDDIHAIYVKLALEKLGHKAYLWYTADFPTQQKHSFELKNHEVIWNARGVNFNIQNDLFDIVWYRRPGRPILPNNLHPDDKESATKENMAFFHAMWHVIAPNAKWINHPGKSFEADYKLLQLKIAKQVNLKIPPTLISNDPNKIRAFIKKHQIGDVIYKTLMPSAWIKDKKMRLGYTNTIKLDDLPNDSILQMTPGIFQKKIDKAFELRITMMGNHPVAVKIDSQKHPKGIMDWRYIPTHELSIEKIELPPEITEKCRALMNKLGLVFGCFDFIVAPDGEYYFLEINEQGQFLWIEDVNPDIKMLGNFVSFLLSFDEKSHDNLPLNISIKDFIKKALRYRSLAIKRHKNPDVRIS